MRDRLQDRLATMLSGVRCDHKDRLQLVDLISYDYVRTDISCADVNTGASVEMSLFEPAYQAGKVQTEKWDPPDPQSRPQQVPGGEGARRHQSR